MPLLRRRIYPAGLSRTAPLAAPRQRFRPAAGPRVVWRFSDGKTGHDNQSRGLVEALQRQIPLDVHELSVTRAGVRLPDLLRRRFAAGSRLPDPWLLVGAGRATQLPLLVARRARRGRAVVIMAPEYPRDWFDLCVIPGHDRPAPAANILVTRGSLNRMQCTPPHGSTHDGLLLIGGPSRHYRWDADAVIAQIGRIIRGPTPRRWVLATSRRTPAGFAARAGRRLAGRRPALEMVDAPDTPPGWLAEQLARTGCAWVTEDSVSMVYESLTAGVATGLLMLTPRGDNRIVRGNRWLQAGGHVTAFRDWCSGTPLRRADERFEEADRAARWICERWARAAPRP